jgi:hypothetical protein
MYFFRLTVEFVLALAVLVFLAIHWYESHPESYTHGVLGLLADMTTGNMTSIRTFVLQKGSSIGEAT